VVNCAQVHVPLEVPGHYNTEGERDHPQQ